MKLAIWIGSSARPANGASARPAGAAQHLLSLCRTLLRDRAEDRELAAEALQSYGSLGEADRTLFLDHIACELSPDPQEVGRLGDAYRNEPSAVNLARLMRTIESQRQELFQRLNLAPGGTKVLIEMRRHVLAGLDQHPEWAALENDLAHLLAAWFNRGFLALKRIDWHTAPIVLERLIEYEAVHQIQGWPDLRRRLADDRRCYGFFHPALPDEPIIFIEGALTQGMTAGVQTLLDPDSPVLSPHSADCAMFYSITNCQEGLRGIPFGNFLIQNAAEELQREFPRLRTFATVSPVPGFLGWLQTLARKQHAHTGNIASILDKLRTPRWFAHRDLTADLERVLEPLCAYYLLHAKKGHEPLDSVARFHLRNGASLERINWLGDTSPAGTQNSASLMVNYVYRFDELARNYELYRNEHRVKASRQIERLARQSFACACENHAN